MTEQRFGPQLVPGGVRFSVWAPGAERVELLLGPDSADQRRLDLAPGEQGYFARTVEDVGPGQTYQLSRDGAPALPDPASRFQPDGVFGVSEVVDPRAFRWTDQGWSGLPPRQLVIYELHVGTFTEQGDYAGVAERLDHLAKLGVTALELMPLAAFPGRWNWGYDGVFHFAPFAGYGRPEQLAALVDACHQRGIAVILDLVTNHFGPEGNAMWSVAPAFFRPDRPTAWSTGHDWSLDPVLRYFDEVALSWIRDYHLDGLRLDAFHAVPAGARPRHLERMVRALETHLQGSPRQVLVLLESVDNQTGLLQRTDHVCVSQLNFDIQRAAHALLTGERHGEYGDFAGQAPEELGRCLERGFAFTGRYSGYHGRVRGESLPLTRWDQVVNFLQNHDTCGNRYLGQRLDSLLGDPELQMAATALLLLHPGLPFLFMGQEWGTERPFHFFTDFPDELGRATQQGRLRGFREIRPDGCAAPGCQDERALLRSRLVWGELEQPGHREHLALVRRLLELRRSVLPEMSRQVTDSTLSRQGAQYTLQIGAHGPSFVLCANLDRGQAMAAPADAELLLATRPLVDSTLVPPRCTALWRYRTSNAR